MLSQPIEVSFDLADGRKVTIGTGKMAKQANGSVTVQLGNAVLLATAVANNDPKEGQDFFPLTVDYQEKYASAGRIPGNFFKREGKLSDYEVLISRLVDRALRPLFPSDYFCDVQIMITLISSDPEVQPDALACLAASAALAVSDIPVEEIISEVRVSRINGQYVINPLTSTLDNADMDFIVAGTDKNLMMVEGESKQAQEEDLIQALEAAHDAIKIQIKAQEELRAKKGELAKRDYVKPAQNEELKAQVAAFCTDKINAIIHKPTTKFERADALKAIKVAMVESLGEDADDATKKMAKAYYDDLEWHVVRNMILDDRIRLDGRQLDQVRPLSMEVDLLPSPHGSVLFTRGETQSLTTCTLGTGDDELMIDTAGATSYSNFILHYNFPGFSTGDIKPNRGPGRREVGHGNLAMRSLKQMMPADYPYTVRLVSDILESNGSSSMATTCAGSLALMDAGVPFPKHVGGIAMGLISREDGKYAILTDILGDEDHLGDMDFKVTGTKDGICGVQMDIKVDGLSMDTMREALEQARKGRLHILDHMYQCMPEYRKEMKAQTPRLVSFTIDKEFIGAVIGKGGETIQQLQKETGTTITIEEIGDKGSVKIFSPNKEGVDKAKTIIDQIIAVPEVGSVYDGTVKSIKEFGAFVEFLPKKEGLLHISEISWARTESMEGIYKEGDAVKVKLVGIDPKNGKFKLSVKALLPRPERRESENK